MGSGRKHRRLVGFRRQVERDEELGRLGKLVLGIIVFEVAVLFFVWSQTAVLRPL